MQGLNKKKEYYSFKFCTEHPWLALLLPFFFFFFMTEKLVATTLRVRTEQTLGLTQWSANHASQVNRIRQVQWNRLDQKALVGKSNPCCVFYFDVMWNLSWKPNAIYTWEKTQYIHEKIHNICTAKGKQDP